MGTEVLRPQDCLVDKLRFSPPAFNRRKSLFVNGHGLGSPKPNNTYSNRKPANVNRPDRKRSPTKEFQPQQRKPTGGDLPFPTTPRRSGSAGVLLQTQLSSKPVTNHQNPEVESSRVTILRRGQSLDSLESNLRNGDFNNKSPKLSSKKAVSNSNTRVAGADVYAGSAIFVSPSPSSLPLPSFFSNKKSESDVSATRDLRRLLGLE